MRWLEQSGVAINDVDESVIMSPSREKLAIKRHKKPGLHFRFLPQLMTSQSPNIKRLLNQISRIRFLAAQAEGKAVESSIKAIHQSIGIDHRDCPEVSIFGSTGEGINTARAPLTST